MATFLTAGDIEELEAANVHLPPGKRVVITDVARKTAAPALLSLTDGNEGARSATPSALAPPSNRRTVVKAMFEHDDDQYYEGLPVKPCMDWWARIFKSRPFHQARSALEGLDVLIPETIITLGADRADLRNVKGRAGVHASMSFDRDPMFARFQSVVQGEAVHRHPVAVCKRKKPAANKITGKFSPSNNIEALTTEAFRNKFGEPGQEDNSGYQQFVYTKTGKPSVIRVAWRDTMKPTGFVISSQFLPSTAQAVGMDLAHSFCASMDNRLPPPKNPSLAIEKPTADDEVHRMTVSIFPLIGRQADEGGIVAAKIARFTQNYFGIRLKQLVVDLIRDCDGNLVFLQVKSFTVHELANLDSVAFLPRQDDVLGLEDDVALPSHGGEKVAAELHIAECPVCCCTYHRTELVKRMSMRMMLELEHHLRKRGVNVLTIRRIRLEKLTHTFKVCDMCWSLYVAENELMDVERRMAVAVGILPPDSNVRSHTQFPGLFDSLAVQPGAVQDPTRVLRSRDVLNLLESRRFVDKQEQGGSEEAGVSGIPGKGKTLLAIGDGTVPKGTIPTDYRGGEALSRPTNEEPPAHPMPAMVHEWRLMLFLHTLDDIPGVIAAKQRGSHLVFKFRMLGKTTSMDLPVLSKRDDVDGREKELWNCLLSRMFVHYLFSSQPRLQTVFTEGSIDFWITEVKATEPQNSVISRGMLHSSSPSGPRLACGVVSPVEEVVAQGSCSLARMEGKDEFNQPTYVLLFSQSFGTCQLKITLGLQRERLVHSRYLLSEPFSDAFIPTQAYWNASTMPDAWLDCVMGGGKGRQDSGVDNGREDMATVEEAHLRRMALLAESGRKDMQPLDHQMPGYHRPGPMVVPDKSSVSSLAGGAAPVFLAARPHVVGPLGGRIRSKSPKDVPELSERGARTGKRARSAQRLERPAEWPEKTRSAFARGAVVEMSVSCKDHEGGERRRGRSVSARRERSMSRDGDGSPSALDEWTTVFFENFLVADKGRRPGSALSTATTALGGSRPQSASTTALDQSAWDHLLTDFPHDIPQGHPRRLPRPTSAPIKQGQRSRPASAERLQPVEEDINLQDTLPARGRMAIGFRPSSAPVARDGDDCPNEIHATERELEVVQEHLEDLKRDMVGRRRWGR
mmetsp:Transcript_51962/g.137470  ORF Transcript_51962/g.137470 Transcript_51962/m.137470 type:complete len:1137 (+) Transcript_51962:167-3577(+)